MKKENKLDITHEIADAIRICLLNRSVIDRVSKDKNASNLALVLIFLSISLNSLINPIYFAELEFGFVGSFIYYSIMIILIFILIYILSKLFGSKANFISFFRPFGYFHILDITSIIGKPAFELLGKGEIIIDFLLVMWFIAILFVIVKEVYKFNFKKTIALFIINILVWMGLFVIITTVLLLFFPNFIKSMTGVESTMHEEIFQSNYFEDIKKSRIDTIVYLKPKKSLSYEQLEDVTKNLETKLELTGYPFKISINLDNLIVIKSNRDLVEKTNFLKHAIVNHEFKAMIGDDIAFENGEDIEYVCSEAECAGIDPNYGCSKYGTNWTCGFRFGVRISPDAAKKHAALTESLNVAVSRTGGRYLSEQLVLYLDDEIIDSFEIGEDMKGEYITDIHLSGSGQGKTEDDALSDTLENMAKLQRTLATGFLHSDLEVVKIDKK